MKTENNSQDDYWRPKTPVAFVIFNRPDTTAKVFEAIRQAQPPKLLVIADGPRSDRPDDIENCKAVRAIVEQVDWDCEVLTNYSDVNLGCRKRVISGLDWVFEQVEEAIILEDDCLPHPTFFRYCQELLEKYRNDTRIMMISGDNFQFGRNKTEHSYYFSRYGHIWGWATWKRSWSLFDESMSNWPELRDQKWLEKLFENEKAATFWTRIFQSVYDGFNTWDYIWIFILWSHDSLTILPNFNLVSNIGFGSGTHTTMNDRPLANMAVTPMSFPLKHPSIVVQHLLADNFTEMTLFSRNSQQFKPVQNIQASAQNLVDSFNEGKYDLVRSQVYANLKSHSNLYLKAIVEARLGNADQAKIALNEILAKNPTHLKARILLSEVSEISEQEVRDLMNQASIYFNQGEIVKALRLGEKAASLDIFVPGLHYLRSVFHSAVARYEEALEAAELEVKFNPEHAEALAKVSSLRKALIKPKKEKIPNNQRTWNTSLPYDLMMSIQNSVHNYCYAGVPIQKNPFDFAIYPLLIWQLKPRTIIEIGSKSGGSALWLGDLFNSFGIDGHIYSVDIVKVTKYSHQRVTFLEGDGQNLQDIFSDDFLREMHRPLLIIEDADHSFKTSKSVLNFFHPYLNQGEYIVVEDGIISDIVQDKLYQSGPHQALKSFLEQYNNEYEIDSDYCDFFGYNLTWSTNGYLKKLTPSHIEPKKTIVQKEPHKEPIVYLANNFSSSSIEISTQVDHLDHSVEFKNILQALEDDRLQDAFTLLNLKKSDRLPIEGLDYLRAICFLKMNQSTATIQCLYEELRYFPNHRQALKLLEQLIQKYPQYISNSIQDIEFQEIYRKIQSFTMLSEARLYSLFTLAKKVCQDNIPGNFVECGVAAGGSTALLATVIQRYTKQTRWVYAFDSFEGMPTPTEPDKSNGIPAEVTGWGTGTCAAPENSVREICNQLGVSKSVRLIKGYFEDTLPQMRDRVGMIAFLHMDGDWYESTKAILNNLYDRLSNHAYVQVDDYGFWEGCRQAVHEFFTQRHLEFQFNKIDSTGVWFQCGENYKVNPAIEASLIQDFREDDPVSYGIQSQMSQNERFQLYYALRKFLPVTTPIRFAEIGSFAGSSLFLNYKALSRVNAEVQGWAIEPGLNSQLQSVLENLPASITHIRSYSQDALPVLQKSLNGQLLPYIFVDGDHSYEGVKQDILNYFPLLMPGGLMIFHDYLPPLNDRNKDAILFHHGGNEPGIRQACQELMEDTYHCEVMDIPLLYPEDPTQTQAFLPIIPDVFSTLRVYRKP